MATYFFADPHWHHSNIIKYSQRPFPHVGAMDQALIRNINAVVQPEDTLWCLGDWSFHDPRPTRRQIHCQHIHFLRGNHDCTDDAILRECFESVQDMADIVVEHQRIILCHYPMFHWDGSHKGAWHLYGHVHGLLKSRRYTLACDVGMDCWQYLPVSMPQLRAFMKPKIVPAPGVTVPATEEGYDRTR